MIFIHENIVENTNEIKNKYEMYLLLNFNYQYKYTLPPFTHLGHVTEIFKSLGVSMGASLESRLSPCSWLLRLGSTPNEAKGGRPY